MVALLLTLGGCAPAPVKTLDTSLKGPQVVANPALIPLGVADLMAFKMNIEGAGFRPGDTVLLSLVGQKDVEVSISLARVEPNGTFRAEFADSQQASLSKVIGILRASTRMNEKMEPVVILTQPTIPPGVYRLRATSLIAPLTAETPVEVVRSGLTGKIKDTLGKWLGKIEDKR
jgi:hypothetical protein